MTQDRKLSKSEDVGITRVFMSCHLPAVDVIHVIPYHDRVETESSIFVEKFQVVVDVRPCFPKVIDFNPSVVRARLVEPSLENLIIKVFVILNPLSPRERVAKYPNTSFFCIFDREEVLVAEPESVNLDVPLDPSLGRRNLEDVIGLIEDVPVIELSDDEDVQQGREGREHRKRRATKDLTSNQSVENEPNDKDE